MFSLVLKIERSKNDHRKIYPEDLNFHRTPSPMIPRRRCRCHSAATRARSRISSWQSTYEELCPGGLNKGAFEEDDEARAAEQPAGSAVDTAAEATATATAATDEQGEKKKNKQGRKGYSKFTPRKGTMQGSYVPVSPSRRKRAP